MKEPLFDVLLVHCGASKIRVVRAINDLGISLKESYRLATDIPSTILKGATRKEVIEMKNKIESAGGKVEVHYEHWSDSLLKSHFSFLEHDQNVMQIVA